MCSWSIQNREAAGRALEGPHGVSATGFLPLQHSSVQLPFGVTSFEPLCADDTSGACWLVRAVSLTGHLVHSRFPRKRSLPMPSGTWSVRLSSSGSLPVSFCFLWEQGTPPLFTSFWEHWVLASPWLASPYCAPPLANKPAPCAFLDFTCSSLSVPFPSQCLLVTAGEWDGLSSSASFGKHWVCASPWLASPHRLLLAVECNTALSLLPSGAPLMPAPYPFLSWVISSAQNTCIGCSGAWARNHQCLSAGASLLSAPYPFPSRVISSAQNTCIGCSGAWARIHQSECIQCLCGLICTFFLHLLLVCMWGLFALLLAPFRPGRSPFGRLLLLPTAGIPRSLPLAWAALTVARWGDPLTRNFGSTRISSKKKAHFGTRPHKGRWPSIGLANRMLLLMSIPDCVWAVPPLWGETVDVIIAATLAMPEPLPTNSGPANAPIQDVPEVSGPEPHIDSLISHGTTHGPFASVPAPVVFNSTELPAPPLNAQEEADEIAQPFEGYAVVLTPRFYPEVVPFSLQHPCSLSTFMSAVRDNLDALRLRFTHILHPTHPQVGGDYASFVLAPKWLSTSSMQVVVFDFQHLGGPVYSAFAWDNITYGDCMREARRHGYVQWAAYAHGCSQPLQPDSSFIAVLGSVIQFRPPGSPPHWHSTLQGRLDRPNTWSREPVLPSYSTERPLLVLFHDRHELVSSLRSPHLPARECISALVDRQPANALFVTPVGLELAAVDHFGIPCRDVMVVFPLTPTPDRTGIIVFLDARQTGNPVEYIFLADSRVEPDTLVRFLHLQAPPTFKIAVRPRPQADGLLHLSEGDVVVFGYVENLPWPSDSDDESRDDDEDGGPDDDSPPGPDTHTDNHSVTSDAVTANPDHAPASLQETGGDNSDGMSRSRSPRGHAGASSHAKDLLYPADPGLFLLEGLKCIFRDHASKEAGYLRETLLSLQFLPVCVHSPVCHGFTGPPFRDLCKVDSPPPWGAKLLEEPTPTSPWEVQALTFLEFFADQFGQPWRYQPAWRIQERLALAPPMPAWEESLQRIVSIAVAIATPGYDFERFSVEVFVPIDSAALLPQVQAARATSRAQHFPMLVPALPQPSPGWILFLALPGWNPQASVALVDSRALDGRLFALSVPPRVNRSTFLYLAGVMSSLPVNVHTSFDPGPLLEYHDASIFPGQCLFVVPNDTASPPTLVLDNMLLSPDGWLEGPALPTPDTQACYCCVTDRGYQLYTAEPHRPWAFRSDVAESCGIPVADLMLVPASPRIPDCTVYGCVCRTAFAVGIRQDPRFLVIVDCRPIMQGWDQICTTGEVDLEEIHAERGAFAPPFWELAIHLMNGVDITALPTVVLTSGQVLVLSYRPVGDDDAFAAQDDFSGFPDGSDSEDTPPSEGSSPDSRGDFLGPSPQRVASEATHLQQSIYSMSRMPPLQSGLRYELAPFTATESFPGDL